MALPPPQPEIVQGATNPVPEPELTVELGDRLTTGHLGETVLYSVDVYYTVQPVTPSLSVSGGNQQPTVITTEQVLPQFYTRSPGFYTLVVVLVVKVTKHDTVPYVRYGFLLVCY